MSKMEKWKTKLRTSKLPIMLFQVVSGIISVVLGLLTFNFRRPHRYVDGGFYDGIGGIRPKGNAISEKT